LVPSNEAIPSSRISLTSRSWAVPKLRSTRALACGEPARITSTHRDGFVEEGPRAELRSVCSGQHLPGESGEAASASRGILTHERENPKIGSASRRPH